MDNTYHPLNSPFKGRISVFCLWIDNYTQTLKPPLSRKITGVETGLFFKFLVHLQNLLWQPGIGDIPLHVTPGLDTDIKAQQRRSRDNPVDSVINLALQPSVIGYHAVISAKASAFIRCM